MITEKQLPAEHPRQAGRGERRHPLDAIFAPRMVAVIGATETPQSVGGAICKNLEVFDGAVYPVNPRRASVFGVQCFPSLGAIGEPVDLAVIATPAAAVPEIIGECAHAGVRGAIIISSGFRECGCGGVELEQQVLAAARRGPVRIVGPNCLGVAVPHTRLNASFAATLPPSGSVAFLSQSGALCTAILDWSLRENVGFSAFVSIGSMLDVGWGDLISYFGDDPRTKSIVIYMESIGEARSFLSAAREVSLNKPIIVVKAGRTKAAAKAAASHTGSLTGHDEVLDAAFRRAGVLRVATIQELFDMAEVLSKQRRPQGPHLAIVTNAGGPAVLATDTLVTCGGELAELSAETQAALDALLPSGWSHGNPVDILGDATAERYARAIEIVFRDSKCDGVLTILTPQAMTDATAIAEGLKPFGASNGKPMLASWMGGPAVDAGEAILNQAGIPTFKEPERAARVFSYMWQFSSSLRSLYETPVLLCESDECAGDRAKVGKLVSGARKAGRTLLTEVESKEILAACGIPAVETLAAFTEDDAVAIADRMRYPVAVKLFSETLTHKAAAGGVRLDVRNANGVRHAWRTIEAAVREKAGGKHFLGVTVQPMVLHHGYEVILGSSIDPQFGPVLLFGAGGTLVEIFKDRALALPPLNSTLALRLMEQTRIYSALKKSGEPRIDLAALQQLLVRFSRLVVEQRWIKEIDINPLVVAPEGNLALDARVLLHEPGTAEDDLPNPAIRPYPAKYITHFKLRDGKAVTIRPIRPEDEPLIAQFHHTVSEQSVHYRYFNAFPLEQRIAHERLARLCFIDYDREMALVAEHRPAGAKERQIVGVGRLTKMHGVNEAEFALIVCDQWQHHGLGTELLKLLVRIGRDEKLTRITATILDGNHDMRNMARDAGFKIHHEPGVAECEAEIVL